MKIKLQAITSLIKAAYQVAMEGGTDKTNTPETFVLSSILQDMVNELIKTAERCIFTNICICA